MPSALITTVAETSDQLSENISFASLQASVQAGRDEQKRARALVEYAINERQRPLG